MKIVFLARDLSSGGAERQLVLLAEQLARCGVAVSVAPFYAAPDAHLPFGIKILPITKRGRWDLVAYGIRLMFALRRARPDILHAYLPAANCLAIALKPFLSTTRIVWGVRASDMDASRYDWLEALAYRVERRLARFVDLIITNSGAGRECILARGWPADRIVVIPNGINTALFRRNFVDRERVRAEWGISAETPLVGLVGRLDPMKDHETFLRAIAALARRRPDVRGVMIGDGPRLERIRLQKLCCELGAEDRIIWAGKRLDMPAVYSSLDCLCLTSAFGEGTPNAVGEAMACEVPCAVTDVGDAAVMVGDTGRVVPPRQPLALCAAIGEILALSEDARRALGRAARDRIIANYDIGRLRDSTLAALEGMITTRNSGDAHTSRPEPL